MLKIKRTLEEGKRTFTIKCQTTYGYPQKLIGFARIPVTRARQESENKAALLLYGLLFDYVWCLASKSIIQRMYIDSRERYQMKVGLVTKSPVLMYMCCTQDAAVIA